MKIALLRIYSRHFSEGEEWVKDHMTDFVEVSPETFRLLRDFVWAYNDKHKDG